MLNGIFAVEKNPIRTLEDKRVQDIDCREYFDQRTGVHMDFMLLECSGEIGDVLDITCGRYSVLQFSFFLFLLKYRFSHDLRPDGLYIDTIRKIFILICNLGPGFIFSIAITAVVHQWGVTSWHNK